MTIPMSTITPIIPMAVTLGESPPFRRNCVRWLAKFGDIKGLFA